VRIRFNLKMVISDTMIEQNGMRTDVDRFFWFKFGIVYFRERIRIKFFHIACDLEIDPQTIGKQGLKYVRKPVAAAGRIYQKEIDKVKLGETHIEWRR
jgi:hypothetical protein